MEMRMTPEPKSIGGREMVSLAYDIFERLPDGQPLWVKAVASLEEAREEIAALRVRRGRSALDFFVYDLRCGAEVSTAIA
jgi:hypothetical protein